MAKKEKTENKDSEIVKGLKNILKSLREVHKKTDQDKEVKEIKGAYILNSTVLFWHIKDEYYQGEHEILYRDYEDPNKGIDREAQ